MKTKLILLLTLLLCSYVPETEEKIADIIDNRQKGCQQNTPMATRTRMLKFTQSVQSAIQPIIRKSLMRW